MIGRVVRDLLALIALTMMLGAAWYALVLRAHRLRFVPPALEVQRILYAAEESWGWGPGGNETGIIVYAMPDAAREKIEAGGIPWLNGLLGRAQDWRSVYRDWQATPFDLAAAKLEGRLGDEMTHGLCGMGDGIAVYMFRYGFCIPFAPEIEALADRALTQSGNFYAHGQRGMLILIPSERRIVYAYNGQCPESDRCAMRKRKESILFIAV